MTTELDTTALTRAEKRLRKLDELLGPIAEGTVDEFSDAVLVNVRRRRRRHHVTGAGERMVNLRVKGSGTDRVVRVHAAGRIAPIIAGGSQPHVIRAVQGAAIPLYGGALFAASVQHPGTPPDPFVKKGIADTRGQIQSITDDAASELVDDLAHDIGRR